ncbi:DUF5677 domain-containing protein [Stenotrophomonas indicatrix]|uniref:DUF5677 domain-containing protein n=1 Tax=Stenotrophomonas indicatrix TaxID=2045451 RepID=UPI00046E5F95|nr:DUF5677 domain-containing protein [Stenotrophomonas indicatrix]
MTPLTRQTLAISAEQLAEVTTLISAMRPPLSPPGRPQCALFLTVAEQFEAAFRLAQAGLITHSAVHVRSMLEATADLHLLGKDDQHVKRMKYEQVRGEKRFYEQMLASEDLPASTRQLIEGRMEPCLERYRPLHAEVGKNRPSQADNFAAAGMGFVIGLYTMLCSFSHNDLSALALRHQGEPGMTHCAEVPDEVSFLILQLASTALLHAAQPIGAVAAFPDGEFDARFCRLHELHARMMDCRPQPGPTENPKGSRP